MHSSKITDKRSLIVIITSLLSVFVHIYLFQQHVVTKYTMGEGSALCNINSFLNCNTSIASSFSEFLGTPLSIFGIITQLVLLFYFLRAFLTDSSEEKKSNLQIALVISGFAFAASLVMGTISITQLNSLCPFCTAAYALSLLNVLTLWLLVPQKKPVSQAKFLKSLITCGVVILAVGWATGRVVLQKYKHSDFDQLTELRLQNWLSQPVRTINLVAPQKFGPDSAKMKIVEFADFLCSHCIDAFPKLHTFAKTNGDVQIIFQPWPLDGCAGPENDPGRRCDLAKISYCGNQQNKGHEAQEYLFTQPALWAETKDLPAEIKKMSQALALNHDDVLKCMKNPQTLKDIKAQIELGKSLGVEGTPALFINNRLYQGGAYLPTLQETYKRLPQ